MEEYKIFDPPTNEFLSEPKCCCGLIRLREGAMIIGIIQLFLDMLFVIGIFLLEKEFAQVYLPNYTFFVGRVVIVILLIGIKRKDFRLMIPYLLYQVCI